MLTCKSFVVLVYRAEDQPNHFTAGSTRSFTRRAGVEKLHQAKRMIGGIGKRTSWQKKVRCGMKDLWHRREQNRSNRREKMCAQPCSMQPTFTVWWRNGKTAKNLSSSRKKMGLRGQEKWKRSIGRSGVLFRYRCMRCERNSGYMKM